MALHPSLTAILLVDALFGVLFAYLVFEAFHRKQWVDKFLNGIAGVLSLALFLTAVTIGYRYYSAF